MRTTNSGGGSQTKDNYRDLPCMIEYVGVFRSFLFQVEEKIERDSQLFTLPKLD